MIACFFDAIFLKVLVKKNSNFSKPIHLFFNDLTD